MDPSISSHGNQMTTAQRRKRNFQVALKARLHGARYAWTVASESSKAGIAYSVGFASVEQESNFKNVFGHDPGGLFPGERVTRAKVKALLQHVANGGVSNGVGFTQLTYEGFIKQADALPGGASKVANQCRVGFGILHDLHKAYGSWYEAFYHYNGSGDAAVKYARMMEVRVAKWHRWLT